MRDSFDDTPVEPLLKSQPDFILRFLIAYAKDILRDRNSGPIASLKRAGPGNLWVTGGLSVGVE